MIASVFIASLACGSVAGADETVQVCGSYANNLFTSGTVRGITATGRCPTASYNGGGFGLFNSSGSRTTQGQSGRWQTTTPAGLELVGATAQQIVAAGVNAGADSDYGGGFYYAGGGTSVNGATSGTLGMIFPSPSSYFGMQITCGRASCSKPAVFSVGAFSLYVRETNGPSLASPTGLWQASGWVRGSWPFGAWGNSPSGLCSISASLNGQLIGSTTSARDVSVWHQCAAPPINRSVDTTRSGQGAMPLTLSATDAAAVPASVSKTVYVDNSAPTVSLSGPVDAPSTAGTQYVAATAGGSPSGIADIVCSVDGGPGQSFAGASAQVPVSGIGQHSVSCYAENSAVDPAGVHGRSTTASWSLKIGVPTVLGVAFDRFVGLRCHHARVRVRVPGHWTTVRRHGKRVRVKTRARTKLERVVRCHPRTVLRRTVVFVRVRRHGHVVKVRRVEVVRVVVPPRVIAGSSRRVAFGHGTTVSGYLGTTAGTALAGRSVRVLTAPDDGSDRFTQAAVVSTAANGTWTARLPAGPSRIVEAVYGGDPTTEGAFSGEVHAVVAAKVKLISVSPKRIPWGGTVRITGRLLGGYLPAGGALVRLRIGEGSSFQTYGVQEHVAGSGRFTTSYTFGAGDPRVFTRFWFQVATLPIGDYPYAPGASGRGFVLVGGHPQGGRR